MAGCLPAMAVTFKLNHDPVTTSTLIPHLLLHISVHKMCSLVKDTKQRNIRLPHANDITKYSTIQAYKGLEILYGSLKKWLTIHILQTVLVKNGLKGPKHPVYKFHHTRYACENSKLQGN